MDLYVGNLAQQATMRDLALFFTDFGDDADFHIIENPREGAPPLRYALVRIPSERQARKAIRKLNGKSLHDRPVTVREYVYRAYSNDRRAVGWRNMTWNGVERRQKERRHISDPQHAASGARSAEKGSEEASAAQA